MVFVDIDIDLMDLSAMDNPDIPPQTPRDPISYPENAQHSAFEVQTPQINHQVFDGGLITPPDSSSQQFLRSGRVRSSENLRSLSDERTRADRRRDVSSSPTPAVRREALPWEKGAKSREEWDNRGPVPKLCWKLNLRPDPTASSPSPEPAALRSKYSHQKHQIWVETGKVPDILFRGFSAKSQGENSPNGFRAGAFNGLQDLPPCPDVKDPIFLGEATRHVELNKACGTPFISFTKNPIRALLRAFCFEQKGVQGYIALVKVTILKKHRGVHAAGSLELKTRTVQYDARGDYLVWGSVPAEAIISVVNVAELLEKCPFTPNDSDVFALRVIAKAWRGWFIRSQIYQKRLRQTFETAIAVGSFARMLGVEKKMLRALTDIIIEDWAIQKIDKVAWHLNEEFMNGLLIGFEQGQPESFDDAQDEEVIVPDFEEGTSYRDFLDQVFEESNRQLSSYGPAPAPQPTTILENNGNDHPEQPEDPEEWQFVNRSDADAGLDPSVHSVGDDDNDGDDTSNQQTPAAQPNHIMSASEADSGFELYLPWYYEQEMRSNSVGAEDPFEDLPKAYEEEMEVSTIYDE